MSSCNDCKKKHQSQCEVLVNSCDKDAVFTRSQTEKIVQIASKLDECLLEKIESMPIFDGSEQFKKIECQINGLEYQIEKVDKKVDHFDSRIDKVEKDVEHLDRRVDKVEKEVDYVQCEVKVISEKTAKALLCQANELDRVANQLDSVEKDVRCLEKSDKVMQSQINRLDCEIAKLRKEISELDFKDDRIDSILCMISSMVCRGDLDKIMCEIEKLRKEIKCLNFKDDRIEDILRRLACLEAKKLQDPRVDALLCEIANLEKRMAVQEAVNCKQQKSIDVLYAQNVRQSEDIKALSERMKALECKLNRNSCILDGKIDSLENQEMVDKKVDAKQDAMICSLQEQIAFLKREIDRIEKSYLVKPCK